MNETENAQALIQDDEISLLDLLQVVVDNLRLLVLGPLLVGLLALAASFIVAPTFTAETRFLPPQQQQSAAASMLASLGALGGLAGAATGIKNPADQYLAFLKSNALRDTLIQRFGLLSRFEVEFRIDARKALDGVVKVTSGKDGLITVEVDDKDPEFAARLANAHVEELGHLLKKLAVTEAQQRRLFFESQLKQVKSDLAKAQLLLQATGVSEQVLKSSPAAAVADVAELNARVTAQEVRLGTMRGYLAENSPEFKLALNELASLRAQLVKLGKSAESTEQSTAPDYVNRYREFKYQEALFEIYARQYEIARVDESREGAVIQVLDVAQPPERKSKPKKALIAILATLAAGFVLLLFVFVRQAFRNSLGNPETAGKVHALISAWRKVLGRA